MGEPDLGWGFPNPATPPGSSAYYSIRLAPPEQRDWLALLHGWRHRLRSILERTSEARVASAQLDWWQEELERIFAGHPTHPLGLRLAPEIARLGLPKGPFGLMIESARADVGGALHPTFADVRSAAADDLGALFELVSIAGRPQRTAERAAARQLGAYVRLVQGIRDSGRSARRGRWDFLSADLLRQLDLKTGDLALPGGRHRLPSVLAGVAEGARALRGAGPMPAELPLTLRIRVRLSDRLLAEIAATDYAVADGRLALTPIRKLWNAWRESRR